MNDTSPEARKKQFEIIFSKTQEERFLMGMAMIDYVRLVTENSIKEKHPGISEIDLKIEVFKRNYKNDFSPEKLNDIISWMRKTSET